MKDSDIPLTPTCHDKALMVCQILCEQPGDDHLWTDEEPYLLLYAALAQHPSAQKLVCKVHLQGTITFCHK